MMIANGSLLIIITLYGSDRTVTVGQILLGKLGHKF